MRSLPTILSLSSLWLALPLHAAEPAARAPAPAATAPSSAPAPAAVERPLPLVALVPLSPVGDVKPAAAHLGSLWAVLVEQAALQSTALNVVTQGAQVEMLEDLGIKPGDPIQEATARQLAQLSGATDLVFGTFAPADGGAFTWTLQHFGVLAGKAKELAVVKGPVADALAKTAEALARELSIPPLPTVAVPATEKAQRGFVRCVSYASLVLERSAVKGRKMTLPKDVVTACKDAAADKQNPAGQGTLLAAQALTGDKAAPKNLRTYVTDHPTDRLGAMALVRRMFQDEQYDDADAELQRLRTARPRDPDILRLAGELAKEKDDWKTAHELFRKAVAQAPNSPYLHYLLSYSAYRTDDQKQALEHARDALRLAGGEAPFYQLNLGERFLDSGALNQASLQLQRAAKNMPNRLTVRVRLGYAFLLQGDADRALEELQAAEKLKPTEREKERGVDLLLKLDLARAHALKGNTKEAIQYLKQLEKAGALEPSDLAAPEFEKLKDSPEFKKLKAG